MIEIEPIPLTGDDILELPLLPSEVNQHRDDCIRQLTEMLIAAEEGLLLSFTASSDMAGGYYEQWGSGARDRYSTAGHLVCIALRRMGFATQDDLERLREELG